MKKIFMVIICFVVAFATTIGLTRQHYNVSASTDYNIFDTVITETKTQNAIYTSTETGFIVETRLSYGTASYVNCYYKLLPNTQFVLRWNATKLIDGSSNVVYAWGSRDQVLNAATDGNEITFTTDETGTGRFLFYSKVGTPNGIYKTEYSNIYLGFVDEVLGAVYWEAYNSGYYDGAKPYEESWELYLFTDDSLSDTCYSKSGYADVYPYHRSSAVFTLPLGYYRVEQKFIELEQTPSKPVFYYSLFDDVYVPIAYLDDHYPPYHLPLDIIGSINNDRYIYFSVPYDDCQVRFQFRTLYMADWDTSFDSLYQLIELSYDENFENRYYEVYERGYSNGKTDGYEEGKRDGIAAGYVNGYNEGKTDGYAEGSSDGYLEGYNAGYSEGASNSISTNWFTSFVDSIFDIFNIEVFPNIKLSYLLFIPIGLGLLALIFKMVRG